MSPKSLLRHKLAVSPLRDFTDGDVPARARRSGAAARRGGVTRRSARVTRVLLCSGKVYYTLLAGAREREHRRRRDRARRAALPVPAPGARGGAGAAIRRREQVYWVQEEPSNMGAWHVHRAALRRCCSAARTLTYVGRDAAASPATGSYKVHQAEEAELVDRAFAR